MAHVFISYHKNSSRDYARKLADYLIAHGFDVWIDDRIDYGNNWEQLIFKAVEQAAAVIVLMTPSSYQSRWVQAERLYAEKNNKPIFPVLLDGDIFPAYLGFQTADVRDGQLPSEDFLHDLEVSGVQRSSSPGRNVAAQGPTAEITPKAHDISLPVAPPTTKVILTRSRRFEAAMPSQIIPTAPTEVWAKISLPDSPGLRGELPAVVPSGDVIGKEDARATGFPFKFPVDPTTGEAQPVTVSVRAKSAALTFDDDEITVELPPDYDSQTVIFTANLNANTASGMRVRVTLDLVYEARLIAQISVSALVQAPLRVPLPSAWTLATTAISAGSPPSPAKSESQLGASIGELPGELQDLYTEDALRGGVLPGAALDDEIAMPESVPAQEELAKKDSPFEGGLADDEDEDEETDRFPAAPSRPAPPQPITRARDDDDYAPRQTAPAKKRSAAPSAPLAMIASLALVVVVVLFVVQSNLGRPAEQVTATGVAQLATGTGSDIDEPTFTPTAQRTATNEPPPTAAAVRVGLAAAFADCPADTPQQIAAGLSEQGQVQLLEGLSLDDPAALAGAYDLVLSGSCAGDTLTLRVDVLKRVTPPEVFDLSRIDVSETTDKLDYFTLISNAAINYLAGDFATAATQFDEAAQAAPQVEQGYPLYFMKANGLLFAGEPADSIDDFITASQASNLFAQAANNRAIASQELLIASGVPVEVSGEIVDIDAVFSHLQTAHENLSGAAGQAVIETNLGLASLYFGRDLAAAQTWCTDALNFNPDNLLAQACLVGVAAMSAEQADCPVGAEPLATLTQSLAETARLGANDPVAWADVLYWQARLTERIGACEQAVPVAVATLSQQRADLLAQQSITLQTDRLDQR